MTKVDFRDASTHKNTHSSKRICCPSDDSSKHSVDDVSKEVKEQLKDLEEAGEGDAKPE